MAKQLQNYVDGEWVDTGASNFIPVIDPATCEVLAETPDSTR